MSNELLAFLKICEEIKNNRSISRRHWSWEKIFNLPRDKFQELIVEGDRWTPEQLDEMDRLCGVNRKEENG